MNKSIGDLLVCRGTILNYTCHKRAKGNADLVDSKQIGVKMDSIRNNAKGHIPAANHPWRHFIISPTATETYAQKTNLEVI